MAIALANKVIGTSAPSGTTVATSAFSASAGNLIFAMGRASANGATMTIRDTAGNTYIKIGSTIDNSGLGDLTCWYAKSITGNASNVVSVDWSASNTNRTAIALEYSGLDTAAPLDVNVTPQNTQSGVGSAVSNAFTTANANEVIIGAYAYDNGSISTAGSVNAVAMTIQKDSANTNNGAGAEDLIVSSIQTNVTASISNNGAGDWIFFTVSFKAATVAATSQIGYKTLLGVGV